jgi:peptidoglycan/xylan/chitin deacetylase (PgdA/CDA1 family)
MTKPQAIILVFCSFIFSSAICAQSILRKPIPDKLVVLTFDDAVKSHYSFVAPMLRKYGFGATFFVCEFPPDFDDTSKYMTWQQMQQLSNWGFEIGNHTHHHIHVSRFDEQGLTEEIAYIDKKCDSLKIKKPVSFAYPGYDTSLAAIKTLQKLGYVMARMGGDRVYDPEKNSPFFIPSFTPGNDLQKALDAIKQAKDGNIVVLTIHGVPDLAHDWVTTTPEVFETYLKYLKDNHYKVISIGGLLKYIDMKGTGGVQ